MSGCAKGFAGEGAGAGEDTDCPCDAAKGFAGEGDGAGEGADCSCDVAKGLAGDGDGDGALANGLAGEGLDTGFEGEAGGSLFVLAALRPDPIALLAFSQFSLALLAFILASSR